MSFHLSPFSWQRQGEAKLALGKTHHDLSPKTGLLRWAELWHWVPWSRDPAPTATTLRSSSGDAWVCVTRGRQPKAQACSCRSSAPWKSPRWVIQATKQWSQVPKGEDQAAKHAVANIPGLLTKAARAGERSGPKRAAIQLRAVPRGDAAAQNVCLVEDSAGPCSSGAVSKQESTDAAAWPTPLCAPRHEETNSSRLLDNSSSTKARNGNPRPRCEDPSCWHQGTRADDAASSLSQSHCSHSLARNCCFTPISQHSPDSGSDTLPNKIPKYRDISLREWWNTSTGCQSSCTVSILGVIQTGGHWDGSKGNAEGIPPGTEGVARWLALRLPTPRSAAEAGCKAASSQPVPSHTFHSHIMQHVERQRRWQR